MICPLDVFFCFFFHFAQNCLIFCNKKLSQFFFLTSTLLQLTGTGEYHVTRTYDDFEWLQQHLFSQEDVPGIQGVIVSTAFVNSPRLLRGRDDERWNPSVALSSFAAAPHLVYFSLQLDRFTSFV